MSTEKITENKTDTGKHMFYFIVFLRLLATCLITNTHYNNVYPISSLAVGGLLGDVLFFAISGYCYGKGPRETSFIVWYAKRIVRIYPAMLIMLIVNHFGGLWDYHSVGFFRYFIFPPSFLFYGSIMVIYIPVYFVGKVKNKHVFLSILIACIFVWLIVYGFVLDKSSFFMQATDNISCQFLYLSAALFGMYFRKFKNVWQLECKTARIVLSGAFVILCAVIYFAATVIIRKSPQLYPVQIVIQLLVLLLILALMDTFARLERHLKKTPNAIFRIVSFVASLTLEIYAVQRILIEYLEFLPFPVNWIIITALIVVSAYGLKLLCNPIALRLNTWIDKNAKLFERNQK